MPYKAAQKLKDDIIIIIITEIINQSLGYSPGKVQEEEEGGGGWYLRRRGGEEEGEGGGGDGANYHPGFLLCLR